MIWSDHETDKDLLGYRHLIDIIFNLSQAPHLLPATIGVFGDWGSGKSSLLKMVSSKLSLDENNLVLTFNGWLFEGYDDAKAALMETILDEISRRAKLTVKAKRLILGLLGRVKWLRVLGAGVKMGAGFLAAGPAGLAAVSGMEFKELVEKAAETFEGLDEQKIEDYFTKEDQAKTLRRGIREFRKEFGELLKETKIKTLVVIIDDLDRCLPDTIIETLEAIKLFLFVENSAFILGADERLIKYAVRRRFPELPGEKVEVGRDYLEKLIQYPIRIPSLGRSEMETYIALLFLEASSIGSDKIEAVHAWCTSSETIQSDRAFGYTAAKQILKEIPAELEEHLILSAQLAPLLSTGLNGNPRQCKRFLNTLILRLKMAESRGITLSKRILAKLMLLEYFRPETFRLLAHMQATQLGLPKDLSEIESKIFAEEKLATASKEGKAGTKSDDGAGDSLSTKKAAVRTLPANLQTWIEDSFVGGWLLLEPRLSKTDLRPYFYFSRDIL
jgi:predicted KAP-like P-loop ATPase